MLREILFILFLLWISLVPQSVVKPALAKVRSNTRRR
jgi:hypothetical protein